jgi:hypothetical protein
VVHDPNYEKLTRNSPRSAIRRAVDAWNDDNSKYSRRPPALPRTLGLERPHRWEAKTTHERIIEKTASKKLGRIPQFPHHNSATAKRATFRRSDLNRRAINVQQICAGYSNQKQRDACQKRYGVHTEQTKAHAKARIQQARERCYGIKQANRRRMCFNTYLRNGAVPYFAQVDNEDRELDDEAIEEAVEDVDHDIDEADTQEVDNDIEAADNQEVDQDLEEANSQEADQDIEEADTQDDSHGMMQVENNQEDADGEEEVEQEEVTQEEATEEQGQESADDDE